MIRTDFKVRYHGTVIGFLWVMLKPLAMAVVLMSVFSYIFASTPDYAPRLLLGLFLYELFSEATRAGVTALYMKGFLVAKSAFPRWILIATTSANALFTILIVSTAFVLYMSITGRPPSALGLALYLLYLLQLAAIIVSFSLASSVLFVRYRDLNQVWEVVVLAGFFIAPVVYPLEILPERFHFYLYLWIPTPVIQFSRAVLVDGTIPSAKAHLLLALATGACSVVGVAIYRALVRRAAEYL